MNVDREIISAMMMDAQCAHRGCLECEAEDFIDIDCRRIFGVMLVMHESNTPIDLVTVSAMFDADYSGVLATISTACISTSNFPAWIAVIKKRRKFSEFREEMTKCIKMAQEENPDTFDTATQVLASVQSIGGGQLQRVGIEAVEAVTEMAEKTVAVSTGFTALDKTIGGGFLPGNLVIIAGRPSMGKSALAMNIAANLCKRGKTVAVFSIEDSRKSFERRMAQRMSLVSAKDVRDGNTGKMLALNEAAQAISGWSLYINDNGIQTAQSILADCYKIKAQEKTLDLVIVDYLGLIKVRERRERTRQQEIGEITRAMKLLAKDLGTTVVLVSQLNRALESRNSKKPMMSDLRESGDIEQDADLILFPYRPGVYIPAEERNAMSDTEREIADREAWLVVAKNRNGMVGDLRMVWQGEYFCFTEVARTA